MKILTFYILFIVSIHVNAQLSVRNSNFIFVSDCVIFVEDDININEVNSKIFLRNEAQIIQGSDLNGNSGIGELSVYQEGDTSSYQYNYWCSPISENISSSINNLFGISLLQDITGIITSVPVTMVHSSSYNGTANPLNIEPYWIWKFITSDEYSEWVHVQGNIGINPGEGFTMKGVSGISINNPGNNQRYDFRGKPNNGLINNMVTDGNWTLVGNPYPSALDAKDYIWDLQNVNAITGTLYFWEQDPSINSHYLADYVGGYATYTINSAGTLETFVPATFNTYKGDGSLNNIGLTSTSGKQVYRYIPIGQGFMVEGKIGSTGSVVTKNSHREYYKESGLNSSFFKDQNPIKNKNEIKHTSDGLAIIPEEFKRFRINVDFDNIYTRQLVQTFHSSATNGFDYGLESKSPKGVASDAYWVCEGNPYIAQAFNFDSNLKIPLIIKLENQKSIRFRIFDIQNFDNNQSIFLHDMDAGVYVDLRSQDYLINLLEGDYSNRFEITFSNELLDISENKDSSIDVYHNNRLSQLIIHNPNYLWLKSVKFYDILGQLVLSKGNFLSNDMYYINTNQLATGTYIVNLEFNNSRIVKNKKIIIDN